MPAFNASLTLEQVYSEIPFEIVDEVVLTDDASTDSTVHISKKLGIQHIVVHELNSGYGANQKTCYKKALEINADIIIMLHPDYQYTPKLIPSMAYLIANDLYSVVLGSRILGGKALSCGMPFYKYVANRVLTLFQNLITGAKLSEYHTGYRAYSSEVLNSINWQDNSDDFIFDNEILSQIIMKKISIAEITCPAKYFKEASSIGFINSLKYGIGVVLISIEHLFQAVGIINLKRYN